jgi:hypothetical protein
MNNLDKNHPFNYFEKNNYLVLKNFVDKNLCNFLYDYIKLSAKRLNFLDENIGYKNLDESHYGTFRDHQAYGDYSKYGDPVFDTLLKSLTDKLSYVSNMSLIPTYSYHRLYTTDTELKKHKDRPSCEISTTLCLGYDISNLDYQYNWPIFVKTEDGDEISISLEPGDMILYKGCVLEHWREPYKGKNHAQVFLHYNNKNGKYNNLYDNRPELGLPASFKINE